MKTTTILIVLFLAIASCLSAAQTKTTTTLTSSLNPSTYGEAVTFTAVVAPAPPGGETVTFFQGKNVIGTGALSGGAATFTTSTLPANTDTIKATYPGDGTFAASTSSAVSQVVAKASTTTTLVSSPNPSGVGQPVTLTATVTPEFSGTPSGKASFYNGGTKLGNAPLSGGVAVFTTTKLPVATDSLTAVYNGSTSFTTSTSNTVSQVVNTGTFIDSSMTWDGITRYYEVYLPATLGANPPMVLMLHGTQTRSTGSDPQPIISMNWGWQSVADQYGFILVKPASTYDPATNQWNWNAYFMDAAFPYAQGCGVADCPDDSGFLGALIISLSAQYSVDPNKVYVAGFSSGAQMAERVGVDLSSLVAAIAPVSGQLEGQQSPPPPALSPAAPIPFPPVSVLEWHGTLDTNLPPCNYGTTLYNAVRFYLDTVDDTFNYWTGPNTNACTTFQTAQTLCLNGAPNNANDAPTPGLPGFTGNIATGCTNNVTVQFIWEPNVAHSWQQQYNTFRWQFFAANPKPAAPKR